MFHSRRAVSPPLDQGRLPENRINSLIAHNIFQFILHPNQNYDKYSSKKLGLLHKSTVCYIDTHSLRLTFPVADQAKAQEFCRCPEPRRSSFVTLTIFKESNMAASNREARKSKVMEVLNKARAMELYAITQYMNQHYALDDMDYGELAANMKLIAIDEMRHAEMFAERLKELGGDPTTERDGKLVKGQDVRSIYPFDANVEDDTIDAYNQFLLVCRENGDNISASLLEQVIVEEQAHQSYFDNVANHIKNLGDTYLSKIAGTPSSTGGTTKGFAISPAGGAQG